MKDHRLAMAMGLGRWPAQMSGANTKESETGRARESHAEMKRRRKDGEYESGKVRECGKGTAHRVRDGVGLSRTDGRTEEWHRLEKGEGIGNATAQGLSGFCGLLRTRPKREHPKRGN